MDKDAAGVAKPFGKCGCKQGYADVSTPTAPKAVCEACGTGVKTCADVTKKATACTLATDLVAGTVCKAKAAIDVDMFFYDTGTSLFEACD